MKNIICSHGFGVRADSRGMYPEIAASFPDDNFVMFDYNRVSPDGDTTVAPLESQAKILQQIINAQPEGSVLLCHSQGCIIAGLVDLKKVSQIILLAPPMTLSMQRVLERITKRPGSSFNPNGTSLLRRSDGTATYIEPGYIRSLNKHDPKALYEKISAQKPCLIIRALYDEVLGLTNTDQVNNAEYIDIASDHNFTGKARQLLIQSLQDIL